jgi:hypothetical protein
MMGAKDKPTIESLAEQIASLEAPMAKLFEQQAAVNKRILAIRNKQDTLRKQKAALELEAMKNNNVVDWGLLMTYEPGEPYYKMLNDTLCERFPDLSLSQTGYSPEARQYSLRVALTRGDMQQVANVAAAITEILPSLKVTDTEHGYIYFGIFERGLSEYETYVLVYKVETKKWLVGTHRAMTGRRDWDHGPFKKLEDALIVISNNYWYRTNEDEE